MKIAVFYPWTDILERNSGSSLRTGFMIDALSDAGHELTVVAPCIWPDVTVNGVRYTSFGHRRWNRYIVSKIAYMYHILFSILTFGRSKSEDLVFWMHYDPSFLSSYFVDCVENVTNWADAVIIEYTFWGSQITKVCRRKNKKTVITALDVLHLQITKSSLMRKLTMRAELKALKGADHVACVSSDDQETFKKHGIDSELIPHGMDMEKYRVQLPDDEIERRLNNYKGFRIPRNNVCFFVGNMYYPPNIRAAEEIKKIAQETNSRFGANKINFVVAGRGSRPNASGNYYYLGEVDHDLLQALYKSADIILVPLLAGTGSSLKTIEAMGYGKMVIGTSKGFRGYPVESGVNCILEDDLSSYAGLINEYLTNSDKRSGIEANAARFAANYDYRILYQKYTDLLTSQSRTHISLSK